MLCGSGERFAGLARGVRRHGLTAPCGRWVKFREDDAPAACLQNVAHRPCRTIANLLRCAVHNHHRSIWKVTDSLTSLFALSRDIDRDRLAEEERGSQRRSDLMQIDRLDSTDFRHALQPRVASRDAHVIPRGEFDQHAINTPSVEFDLLNPQIDPRILLHVRDEIEPSPPARALVTVFAVAERLQFFEDELRDDQRRIEDVTLRE